MVVSTVNDAGVAAQRALAESCMAESFWGEFRWVADKPVVKILTAGGRISGYSGWH